MTARKERGSAPLVTAGASETEALGLALTCNPQDIPAPLSKQAQPQSPRSSGLYLRLGPGSWVPIRTAAARGIARLYAECEP